MKYTAEQIQNELWRVAERDFRTLKGRVIGVRYIEAHDFTYRHHDDYDRTYDTPVLVRVLKDDTSQDEVGADPDACRGHRRAVYLVELAGERPADILPSDTLYVAGPTYEFRDGAVTTFGLLT
jgi:hypothetical protein